MMKKILLILLAFTATLQGHVCKNKGLYIAGFGGTNFLEEPKNNTGLTGGLALGYKFFHNGRFEIEGACRYNSSHLYYEKYLNLTYSLMANAYYDFNFGYNYTPYLGFGAGYVYTKADWKEVITNSFQFSGTSYLHERSQRIGYQGIAGVETEAWRNIHIGIEYRCFFRHGDLRDQSALLSLKNYF